MVQKILNDVLEDVKRDIEIAREVLEENDMCPPKVLIVNANPDDTASLSYIKNKVKIMEENGCDVDVRMVDCGAEAYECIKAHGHRYNSIICQLPLKKEDLYWEKEIMGLIKPEQDIDRLTNHYADPEYIDDLPATAHGIMRMLFGIRDQWELPTLRVWLRGNGRTVNRRLFRYLINYKGFDVRLTNSKTSDQENEINAKWCDLVVSATGIPESLYIFDKMVISPTLHKREDGKWVNDLVWGCGEYNDTHGVLKNIGLLTTHIITLNALSDIY